MFAQLLAIARNTFVESVRQPIYLILILICGIFQVFNTLLSAYTLETSTMTEVVKDDKLLLDMGLATVLFCATLLAAFTATSVLSREIENKTALTVISKPVGRPLFVIGKYLGVAFAIAVAVVIMLTFFLFAIRHGVMSTARDTLDGPVILFAFGSVGLAIIGAAWTNFFYGWVFPSTASFLMLVLLIPAYGLTLTISEEWTWQSITTEFKPQIMLASFCVLLAMLILAGVAIVASTKLGQVMTIVICSGGFLAGLLSNHLMGRYAFSNDYVARVASVEAIPLGERGLGNSGETLTIFLDQIPRDDLPVGASIYYGPSPQGINIRVPQHDSFEGDPTDIQVVTGPESQPALIVQAVDLEEKRYTIVRSGSLVPGRLPVAGDYVFNRPTEINPAALAGWALVPNIQSFWLIDAITQGHSIPLRYIGLVLAYTIAQITGLMALAVMLFQRREVG